MNTQLRFHSRLLLLVAFCVAAAATLGLAAAVGSSPGAPARPEADITSDGSFDHAEHQRHLSLIRVRADGFEQAEEARFARLNELGSPALATNGFDRAERARHLRAASR